MVLRLKKFIEEYFKFDTAGTDIKSEILAGVTNYFTLIYILMLVPEVLVECFPYAVNKYGELNSLALVYGNMTASDILVALTAISFIVSGLASIILGFILNLPIVQGPSLAIATFVTYTICKGFGYTYSQALAIVFISGILFFLLSITGAEKKIHKAIPDNIKYAVGAGIGLFIVYNGLIKAHIIQITESGYKLFDFSAINDYNTISAFLALVGVIFIIILIKYHIHAAIFIGKVVCIIAAFPLGLAHIGNGSFGYNFNISSLAFNMDFKGLINTENLSTVWISILTIIIIVFALCIMDIFETISMFIAMDSFAEESHKVISKKGVPRVLEVDAVTTSMGAVLGVTNVSTYVESTAGIIEGGRTGFTAVVTGLLFILSVPFSPLMSLVPSAATATTLIVAGIMMMGVIRRIDFENIAEAAPSILAMILMPLTNSILVGIAAGIITYVLIYMFLPKARKFNIPLFIMAVFFVIMLYFIPR